VTIWEPQTYLKYAEIRFRAGFDLISRIPKADYRNIYDLGCGTGHLTRILADNFPNARVSGLDSSPEMLAEARREFPTISWMQADIGSWRPEAPPDLVYSNAALHWVPRHEQLFPALLKMLNPGGVLAVQMPRHFESPSHLGLRELARQPEWRARLEPLLLATVPSPEIYWEWLSPHASDLDIWETIYLQVLDGKDPVVNFMRGTALRPLLSALNETEGKRFITAFSERMASAYPPRSDGKTLFPFRRMFVIARR
jgi:trans-aconitate 2-methyltransferase